MFRDIIQDPAEANLIEAMRGGLDGRGRLAIGIFVQKSGRERQRGCFSVNTAGGRLIGKLGGD